MQRECQDQVPQHVRAVLAWPDGRAELVALLSPEGLRLLDALPPSDSTADCVRHASPTARRRALRPSSCRPWSSQARLRAQARERSSARSPTGCCSPRRGWNRPRDSRSPLCTPAASRRRASAGSPTSAAASAATRSPSPPSSSRCTAVERDEVTAAIAAYNLAPFPTRPRRARRTPRTPTWAASTPSGSTLPAAPPGTADPARRRPEDYSPSLDFAFGLAERMPTGIKLGPGFDRDLIPAESRRSGSRSTATCRAGAVVRRRSRGPASGARRS